MKFNEFVQGFAGTPFDFAVVIIFLGSLFVVLLFFSALRLHKSRRRIERRSQRAYEDLISRSDLSPADRDLIEELAQELRSHERKYMLLINQRVFDNCVERAIERGRVASQRTAALRVKLGFKAKRTGARLDSSAQIPAGAAVMLVRKGSAPLQAKVLDHEPDFFRVAVQDGTLPFAAGDPIEIIYHDTSGLYVFDSVLKKASGSTGLFRHSEDLQRLQRREFYRRKLALPVYVRHAGNPGAAYASRFYDLGGGGASIENPQKAFNVGDDVSLSFHSESEQMSHIIGRVVRTSKRGTVLHIDFRHIQKNMRDRIYKLLFQGM